MNASNITETRQYLTFMLGDDLFSLDVSQVREVLDLSPITRVPGAPDFMRGVINVRGSVVPVMDLRAKFGLVNTGNTQDTRIVVMDLDIGGESVLLGALADSVHEVKDLDPGQIEKPPKIGSRWQSDFIKGIGKNNDQFFIILDIDRVFSTDEITELKGTDAVEADIGLTSEPQPALRPPS